MLFCNHWEYTRNVTFLRSSIFPLLTGLLEFWDCYLTNVSSSPSSAPILRDWPDQAAEGQTVPNPQLALGFVSKLAHQVLSMAPVLGIDPPSAARRIARHLTPYNSNSSASGTGDSVWTNFAGATTSQSNMWALYPLWPAEQVSLADNDQMLGIAGRSARTYLDLPRGRPVQTFTAAVRAGVHGTVMNPTGSGLGGFGASEIVEGMDSYITRLWGPNLLVYTSGGGIENIGMSRAVNEMLVATDGHVLRLFPGWPLQHPASFVTLRTKDGFLVSASYDNETRVVRTPVSIQSTVGGSCCVLDPWSRTGYRSKSHSRVQVRDNTGNSVDLVWSNKIDARGYFVLSFNTTAGRHYNLSLSE